MIPNRKRPWRALFATLCSTLIFSVGVGAFAVPLDPDAELDRLEPKPERLDAVVLDEQLGGKVPTDGAYTDSSGAAVKLGDFFDGERPVVLTFNYSNCPMLCSLQLDRFVKGLKQLGRSVGDGFEVVTISIDPEETSAQAAESKKRYLAEYERAGADKGWHFLVGSEQSTRPLAASVGFTYDYNEARQEWLHPAAIIVLTPDGRVSRYLYGIEYHPDTLNLALVEASDGKIGSVMDRLVLYCFHYDESEGRYAPVAMNIMRVGAGLAATALAFFLSFYWLVESRRKRRATLASSTAS